MKTIKSLSGLLFVMSVTLFFSCNKPVEAPVEVAVAPSTERVTMMLNDWERAKKYTQAYLDSANEKSIAFKSSPKTPRTFGDQLMHLAEANYGLAQAASGKATELGFGKMEGKDGYKTKAEVSQAVAASYDFVIGALKEMNDTQLKDSCEVFKMKMTKEAAFNKLFEHQTHHRGQTTQYLRAQGLTPPQEMLF